MLAEQPDCGALVLWTDARKHVVDAQFVGHGPRGPFIVAREHDDR
jgi:hypothetical protein